MIGLLVEMPDLSTEQSARIIDELGLGGKPPAGQVFHAEGPMAGGGTRVVDVWESQEALDAFMRDQLGPIIQRLGLLRRRQQSGRSRRCCARDSARAIGGAPRASASQHRANEEMRRWAHHDCGGLPAFTRCAPSMTDDLETLTEAGSRQQLGLDTARGRRRNPCSASRRAYRDQSTHGWADGRFVRRLTVGLTVANVAPPVQSGWGMRS